MEESKVNFVDINPDWPSTEHDLLAVGDNPQTIFFFEWQRDRGLDGRLLGYRKAAEMLAQQVVNRRRVDELDTVFFPYAFIWRHYMELMLKSLVLGYRVLLDKPREERRHHKLVPLWQELRGLMKEAGEDVKDDAVKASGRLLEQFNALDPSSEEFRYDERNGQPTLEAVTSIDYVSFHKGLSAVANFLEAVESGLSVKLDFKREMRAEYEAYAQDLYDYDRY